MRDSEHRASGVVPHHALAPQDTLRLRWLVLSRRACSAKELATLEQKNKGKPRAISPPFVLEDQLVCEYKWFGHPDSVAQVVPFEEVAELFGMHEAFLEWLTEMLSASCEDVIGRLEEQVGFVNVRLYMPDPYPYPYPV